MDNKYLKYILYILGYFGFEYHDGNYGNNC